MSYPKWANQRSSFAFFRGKVMRGGLDGKLKRSVECCTTCGPRPHLGQTGHGTKWRGGGRGLIDLTSFLSAFASQCIRDERKRSFPYPVRHTEHQVHTFVQQPCRIAAGALLGTCRKHRKRQFHLGSLQRPPPAGEFGNSVTG